MIIKVSCNWSSNDDIKIRLIEQFGCSDVIEGIEIISEGNNYDVLIAFGHITELPIDNKPIFVFPQEPTWSGSHQKNFNEYKNIKVFGFDKSNYSPQNVVVETIAHMFYGGRGPWEEGHEFWTYNNLTRLKLEKQKDICSFVSNRGLNDESFPKNCLYKERIDLVKSNYEKLNFIDFYGWGNSGNLKPHVGKKYETIKDYKFCLTIENSNEGYYISEKFYDCILTNTIPIYYGCTNIKDFWSENGYILLDNITDHEYLINKLNWIFNNKNELYEQMLPDLLKMKKKYFEEFNIIKKIKKEFYEL